MPPSLREPLGQADRYVTFLGLHTSVSVLAVPDLERVQMNELKLISPREVEGVFTMSQKNRKLGRTSDQRRAMLRAMVTYLLENGQIKTTVTRAKEVAPVAEKMVTLAKTNTLASYRQALSYITKEDVANKLFKEIGPKYADRNGGYTRIVRIGPRRGDAAEMAIIQLV